MARFAAYFEISLKDPTNKKQSYNKDADKGEDASESEHNLNISEEDNNHSSNDLTFGSAGKVVRLKKILAFFVDEHNQK